MGQLTLMSKPRRANSFPCIGDESLAVSGGVVPERGKQQRIPDKGRWSKLAKELDYDTAAATVNHGRRLLVCDGVQLHWTADSAFLPSYTVGMAQAWAHVSKNRVPPYGMGRVPVGV